MATLPPRLISIHNGLIQPVIPPGKHDWYFRAYSNHRDSSDYFDFETVGCATFYLWVVDEVAESRRRRLTSHSE